MEEKGRQPSIYNREPNRVPPQLCLLLVHSATAAAASNSVHFRRPARSSAPSLPRPPTPHADRPPDRPPDSRGGSLVAMDVVALKNQLNNHIASMYAAVSITYLCPVYGDRVRSELLRIALFRAGAGELL